jgi:hypothetical protein
MVPAGLKLTGRWNRPSPFHAGACGASCVVVVAVVLLPLEVEPGVGSSDMLFTRCGGGASPTPPSRTRRRFGSGGSRPWRRSSFSTSKILATASSAVRSGKRGVLSFAARAPPRSMGPTVRYRVRPKSSSSPRVWRDALLRMPSQVYHNTCFRVHQRYRPGTSGCSNINFFALRGPGQITHSVRVRA